MGPPAGMESPAGSLQGKEPDVMYVTFNKVNGSMGLSIVAAKVRLRSQQKSQNKKYWIYTYGVNIGLVFTPRASPM